MIIIELTQYESEFIEKSTDKSGAYKVRSFDIDHRSSLVVYYHSNYIQIGLRRYNHEATSLSDWEKLKAIGVLYPDIDLSEVFHVWFDPQEHRINLYLPNKVNERRK